MSEPKRGYRSEYIAGLYKKYKSGINIPSKMGLPKMISGSPFDPDEEQEIYRRCLELDCFWQDLPDVVKRVREWEEECRKIMDDAKEKGEIVLF